MTIFADDLATASAAFTPLAQCLQDYFPQHALELLALGEDSSGEDVQDSTPSRRSRGLAMVSELLRQPATHFLLNAGQPFPPPPEQGRASGEEAGGRVGGAGMSAAEQGRQACMEDYLVMARALMSSEEQVSQWRGGLLRFWPWVKEASNLELSRATPLTHSSALVSSGSTGQRG